MEEVGMAETLVGFLFSYKLLALVVAVYVLVTSVVITPGKRAKVIERLGQPLKAAFMPGLNFKMPWPIDRVVGMVNLQLREIKEDVTVKTGDDAFMTLPVRVQFRASNDPKSAVMAHFELQNPSGQITSYVLNNVRQTASGMTMADLYQNRDTIEERAREALNERFSKYGYEIESVLVDEPQPSAEVREAFNKVIASKRAREAAENFAAAERIKLIGVAEAEKESKRLQGEGLAQMREAIAKGMDVAMHTLTEAGMTPDQALMLLMDTNRLDTLGSAAAHGNLVLVDMKGGGELATTMTAVRASQGVGGRSPNGTKNGGDATVAKPAAG